MKRVQSCSPIVSERSKLIILGSMPGELSLKASQYYAHPQNTFWDIMGELFEAGPSLPYTERVARLQSVGVASGLHKARQSRRVYHRKGGQRFRGLVRQVPEHHACVLQR
jgi:hypoxanthine-DNA glycosylase